MAVDAEVTPEQEQQDTPTSIAELSNTELFQWNAWVHLGVGVDDCPLTQALADPERDKSKPLPVCSDDAHFHAWVRLPNPFQRRDIVDKSNAARARKMRELRDPESDAAVILEDELSELTPADKENVILEIVQREYQEDLFAATNEILETEGDADEADDDGEPPRVYANIDQDMEELHRLDALPEDQRNADEYEHLRAHVESYHNAVGARTEELQATRTAALREQPWDALLERVRKERREWIAGEVQVHTFQMWQMLVCTFKPRAKGTPQDRVWGDINDMRFNAPPEALEAVKATFTRLGGNWANSQRAKN